MKKYRIDIPTPSAKRLEADRTLVFLFSQGWEGDIRKETVIPEGVDHIVIDGPDELISEYNSVSDGDYHAFWVVYRNSTKSRKETIRVEPTPIEDLANA